ncbi:MAG: hypothetical protein ACR2N3_07790 [Pyrinomonadaceae bacterium]
MMNSDRWEKIKGLFDVALEIPSATRVFKICRNHGLTLICKTKLSKPTRFD